MPEHLGVIVGWVLLLRVGQTLMTAGCVRSKNAAAASVHGVLDAAVVLLAAWALAGLFLPSPRSGGTPLLAWSHVFGNGGAAVLPVIPLLLIFSGAILGATGERVRVLPPLVLSAVASGLLVPSVLWVFWRLIHADASVPLGMTVATVGGGAAAFGMASLAGARKGKFNRDLSVNYVPGHAVPLQIGGLLLMAAAWAVLSVNPLHTLLGFAAAVLAATGFAGMKFGKIDVGLLIAGGVGGLAAGSIAAVDTVPHIGGSGGALSVLAGAIAGAVVPWAVMKIETGLRADDVTGLCAAYVVGGTVGTLVATLTRRTTLHAWASGVVAGVGACVVAAVVCGGAAYLIARAFAARGALRVSETVEYDGLDLSELDVNAYPDFQQTMIKSHHLRQL